MKKLIALLSVLLLGITLIGCNSEDAGITIGANIYTFGDNFMNGVVRPELEAYAEHLGVTIDIASNTVLSFAKVLVPTKFMNGASSVNAS